MSTERNNDPNVNVLVFDFRGQEIMDLRPQVVGTKGGNGLVGGERNISQCILELVERVSTLFLI